MRVVCTADLHEHLAEMPVGDLLLIAGDLTSAFGGARDKRDFLTGSFAQWLASVHATDVVVVAGNHDRVIENDGFPHDLTCHYLEDDAISIGGLKVWGTPWQPWFHDWAFNAATDRWRALRRREVPAHPRGHRHHHQSRSAPRLRRRHGPPLGYGDRTAIGNVGSEALTAAIDRVQPRLVVCGDIHEDAGRFRRGPTEIVNASLVDQTYSPANPPIVIDV